MSGLFFITANQDIVSRMAAKSVLKNDKYKKARGGYSRLLNIRCAKCDTHLFYYHKDGPGSLKGTPQLVCPSCKQLIGIPISYKKENRLAYRLFTGAISKRIANSKNVRK